MPCGRFPGRWKLHRRRHHRHRHRYRHRHRHRHRQHQGWVDRCRRGKQERFSRPSRSTTAPIYLRATLLSRSLSLSCSSSLAYFLQLRRFSAIILPLQVVSFVLPSRINLPRVFYLKNSLLSFGHSAKLSCVAKASACWWRRQ